MKLEIKKLWIDALRSGEYEQGTQALRNGNHFCCLGVLCNIHSKEMSGRWIQLSTGEFEYDNQIGQLPSSVVNWAGLEEMDPEAGGHLLSTWNDIEGTDFAGIADLIEDNL